MEKGRERQHKVLVVVVKEEEKKEKVEDRGRGLIQSSGGQKRRKTDVLELNISSLFCKRSLTNQGSSFLCCLRRRVSNSSTTYC